MAKIRKRAVFAIFLQDGRAVETTNPPISIRDKKTNKPTGKFTCTIIHDRGENRLITVEMVKGVINAFKETSLQARPPQKGDIVVTSIGEEKIISNDRLLSAARPDTWLIQTDTAHLWVQRHTSGLNIWREASESIVPQSTDTGLHEFVHG